MKFILRNSFPEGLIFLICIVLLRQPEWWVSYSNQIEYFPIIILVTGIVLAWRFHRSRVVYALIFLTITAFLTEQNSLLPVDAKAGALNFFKITAFLIPLNLALLFLIEDRGPFTWKGLRSLIYIPLQYGLIFLLYKQFPLNIQKIVEWSPVVIGEQYHMNIPVLSLILLAFTCCGIVWLWIFRERPVQAGLFWSMLTGYGVMILGTNPSSIRLGFGFSGLILLVSLLNISYRMAYFDELTALPGRRAFNTTLKSLGSKYAIAMLDIDHFKKFNDRHGHDAGDQVLQMVAAKIGKVGGNGKAFRYGGEEFVVVFPSKDKTEAAQYLEIVRQSIETARFTIRRRFRPRKKPGKRRSKKPREPKVTVTISIGVASKSEKLPGTEEVLKAADTALYQSKKNGRNMLTLTRK